MNEYTNELGVRYVAINAVNNCEGCAFKHCDNNCLSVTCTPGGRDDWHRVIWVEECEPVNLTHIELTFAATDRIDAVRNTVARLRAVYEPHFTVGKTEITRRGDHIMVSIPLGAKS